MMIFAPQNLEEEGNAKKLPAALDSNEKGLVILFREVVGSRQVFYLIVFYARALSFFQ